MAAKTATVKQNPLATEKIYKLLIKFAVPSIISGLVSALYNIVDQIFIGQGVGMLGNAATNVAFPLTTISIAVALLLGVGSSSGFNLAMGEGKTEYAAKIVGCGLSLLAIAGVLLGGLVILFLEPLMLAFGATAQVLPYAMTYSGITAIGMPMLIFSTGASGLIRSDGSPTYSMVCILSGAILNTILDPLFIFGFDMGIQGAAIATVIGQAVSAIMVLLYFPRFRNVHLTKSILRPTVKIAKPIVSLGMASCFNQLAMTVVQITMNNVLTYYGALSIYGEDIPLAVVGVISKVNIIFMSIIIGIAQGNQPIVGYNYGAKNYKRVRQAYLLAVGAASLVAFIGFALFQLFPLQIVSFFGNGTEEYFLFAQRYLRIYMLMFFTIGLQPVTANFFTSIGKAVKGMWMSLTRQIVLLLPLILLFPLFWGIDGVMYAGPIADLCSAILAIIFVVIEFKKMKQAENSLAYT